jgi:pimeloyl-ACP methyl ester carboxylesterase
VWADVAERYRLNPSRTAIAGYSMGGYSTFKLAVQYPDLFAKGQPTVGPPGVQVWVPPGEASNGKQTNTYYQLESLRNLPFMMWVAVSDELVPFPGTQTQARRFDALGYRYIFDAFAPAEHLTLAFNDQYAPAASFLGASRVNRNPPHVSFVLNPKMGFRAVGVGANHAYWLSGVRLRNATGDAPLGTIDVRSEGFGVGDPRPSGTRFASGALTGGTLPALAYAEQSQSWGRAPRTRVRDQLDITARNVAAVTINAKRARVSCRARLVIHSDGPIRVRLTGCAARAHRHHRGRVRHRRPRFTG